VKVGDLVRWKSDSGIGVVIKVIPFSPVSSVDIKWFTGLGTGRIPSDHIQLELISESR